MSNSTEGASLEERIAGIVRDIRQSEDPQVLADYRKLVKKHVPFFLRGYFTAYLVKTFLPKSKRAVKTLFVGAGKTRRVYPKDLIRFFTETAGVSPDAIGAIRVLDNYSFVEVDAKKADMLISKCDSKPFRGRNLTVNHAKKRG